MMMMDETTGPSQTQEMEETSSRFLAPAEGRTSIRCQNGESLQDTTSIYFIDNKASDINNVNIGNSHSSFLTTINQNSHFSANESSHRGITLDGRSRWVGKAKIIVTSAMPNINEFMFSNQFTFSNPHGTWLLRIQEGNLTVSETINLLNEAVTANYLQYGRPLGLNLTDWGLKFDTRNFLLGMDPTTGLMSSGVYLYKGYHPDIILLQGCSVDFTHSRLGNILGIRNLYPFSPTLKLSYDDIQLGNLPPLLDVADFQQTGVPKPLMTDPNGLSYNVNTSVTPPVLNYRSWWVHMQRSQAAGEVQKYLFAACDATGEPGQMYLSLPDAYKPPITFNDQSGMADSELPVVSAFPFPIYSYAIYDSGALANQQTEQVLCKSQLFNRLPKNEVYIIAPYMNFHQCSQNRSVETDVPEQPLKTSLSGLQRVVITDERRLAVPYITKSLITMQPSVSSSATL